ncbi:MAG: DUF4245 family protein [Dermatophilaceae bacterium]
MSRYAMGSAANMARSLLVILALVAVVVAIVPRGEGTTQPPVDAASVASHAVKDSGQPFEIPVGLGDGWHATSARYAGSTDSRPTWQAVWSTPSGESIALKQTTAPTSNWLDVATNHGSSDGTVELAGRAWDRKVDSRKQTSLVYVSPQGLATVVSTTGGMDEVGQFVAALSPAAPAS